MSETTSRADGTEATDGTKCEPTLLEVLDCMEREGGGFVSRLAGAWKRADLDNQRRLMDAFGHYYADYRGRIVARRGVPAWLGKAVAE